MFAENAPDVGAASDGIAKNNFSIICKPLISLG